MSAEHRVADRLRKLIVEYMDIDVEAVTPAARFVEDLGGDSLDYVEMIMAIEEEFDVAVPDATAEVWLTVGDAVTGIEALLAKGDA